MPGVPHSLASISSELFKTLARVFPVTSASDEFHEFPQVLPEKPQWDRWDCFSIDHVEDISRKLFHWENQLALPVTDTEPPDPTGETCRSTLADRIDRTHLINAIRILREHLAIVRKWERQPTFYLTIASIGMAEALAAPDPAAPHDRAIGIAALFDQATKNLLHVPALFKDLGLEMVVGVGNYLRRLSKSIPELIPALSALDRFVSTLRQLPVSRRFHLPAELFDRIIRFHMNTGMGVETIDHYLDLEIQATQQLLDHIITSEFNGISWEAAYQQIPLPEIGAGGLLGLYKRQVDELAAHLLDMKILNSEWEVTCPVQVKPVPGFLSATRTASSYSIPPGHPPTGGTFFIYNANDPAEAERGYQREYRILSAHETYPGHHLLDSCRWRLENPIRRVIEQPLFYEGWACFAEELMYHTGYLKGTNDLLMLTRRGFWRAIRGKVDLGLQRGTMNLETAAKTLHQAGLALPQARMVVRKYALNPGYQLCYTIGYQKLRDLFNKYGRQRLPWFVHSVLSQGEIHFKDLAAVLKESSKTQ